MSNELNKAAIGPSLESSFLGILRDESIGSLGKIGSEVAVDSVLDDGLLRDVPVVSTICALLKGAKSIRDRLFFRRVVSFLQPLADIPANERRAFVHELHKRGNPEEAAEILLNIVDKVDSSSKAYLLGKLLRAAILREIDIDTMLRVTSMVERSYGPDLALLPSAETGLGIDVRIAENLATIGLMDRRRQVAMIPRGPGHDNVEIFYTLNDYGRIIVKLL